MTSHITVPPGGSKIVPGQATPDNPIIPFIEGDGIGIDITPVMIKVIDAAVAKAYGGAKKIHWMEVFAGEKSTRLYGPDEWFPKETFDALKEYSVSIKGPMTTPVGGGIRSLNVALRQQLDLYVCLRPVRWFKGVPTPVKEPGKTDMVIFRENTEDIYAGIEFEAESDKAKKLIKQIGKELAADPEFGPKIIEPLKMKGVEQFGDGWGDKRFEMVEQIDLGNGRFSTTVLEGCRFKGAPAGGEEGAGALTRELKFSYLRIKRDGKYLVTQKR